MAMRMRTDVSYVLVCECASCRVFLVFAGGKIASVVCSFNSNHTTCGTLGTSTIRDGVRGDGTRRVCVSDNVGFFEFTKLVDRNSADKGVPVHSGRVGR